MIAYFDCFSGISGDMTLGALIDLGVPIKYLTEQFSLLGLDELDFTSKQVKKNGITAQDITIKSKQTNISRDYKDIQALISGSQLPDNVKNRSLDIFKRVALAESHIHNQPLDHVHFHEVGSLDSIADIIGTALCIEYLQISHIVSSKLPLGSGFVTCSHGKLPVPAPATLKILEGVPVYNSGMKTEIVTPTGAAIIASLASEYGGIPDMTIKATGYGAGKKDVGEQPNLLRVILGEVSPVVCKDEIYEISASIDDMNPELHGHVLDKLISIGALDVNLIPLYMKKNRPGIKLEVLCTPDLFDTVHSCIFQETTTLGIRYQKLKRLILKREIITLDTRFGKIKVKKITDYNGKEKMIPEYDECLDISRRTGTPLKDIYSSLIADFEHFEK